MAFWNRKSKKKNENKDIESFEEENQNMKSEKVSSPSKTSSCKMSETKSNCKTEKSDKVTATRTLGRNIYYVSARKDKNGKKVGWEVKKENASKVTRIVNTKEEALEIVKELAGNNESTVIIRKVDGSIQETLKFKSK